MLGIILICSAVLVIEAESLNQSQSFYACLVSLANWRIPFPLSEVGIVGWQATLSTKNLYEILVSELQA